jgi:hypothetical protein
MQRQVKHMQHVLREKNREIAKHNEVVSKQQATIADLEKQLRAQKGTP